MDEETATPETGTVDAAASAMDSVLAELETGGEPQGDAVDDVVKELVEDAEGKGDAEAADAEESATENIDEAEETESDPEKDDEPEPAYKVTVNGEEVEVPLSELVKGYSREQDYTAKTMALGEDKKALANERAALDTTVRAQYASELKQALDLFEAADPVLSEASQIDWQALKASDPALYVQYSEAVNNRLAFIEQQKQKISQMQEQQAQAAKQIEAQEDAARFDSAAKAVVADVPELADETKFQEFAKSVFDYLGAQGFDNESIRNVIDPNGRTLLIVDKARKWDALERAKNGLSDKKVKPIVPIKALKSDASDTRRTSKRLPAKASRDQRIEHVLDQFFEEQ
jgi:hypothetical protein